MRNLERRIAALREELQETHAAGEQARALEISQELDQLIAMQQRENFLLYMKQ